MLHSYLYFFKHQQALLLAHWFPCFLPSRILFDSITVSSIRHPLNLFSFLLFRSKIKSIYSTISSNSVFFLAKYSISLLFFLFFKFAIFLLVTLYHFALYSNYTTYYLRFSQFQNTNEYWTFFHIMISWLYFV